MKKRKERTLAAKIVPRLLGVSAAAAYLGATEWAIRKLQWERKIPSIRIGQRVLFDIRDLDAYIDQHKHY
jgi:excisionase family DNA binding protein